MQVNVLVCKSIKFNLKARYVKNSKQHYIGSYSVQNTDIYFRWRDSEHLNNIEFNKGCKKDAQRVRFFRSHSGVCNQLHPSKQHRGILSLPFSRLLPAEYHG